MHAIVRFTKSLSLSLESFFDDIQNHEAAVAAAMRDVERGATRIRVQRAAVERRLSCLVQAEEGADADHKLWQERARRFREDKAQALECLRRAARARKLAEEKRSQRGEVEQLLGQIAADEQAVTTKLAELRLRLSSLVSREVRAGTFRIGESSEALEGIFDRWQARVEQQEGSSCHAPVEDAFARKLREDEEQRALEAELSALGAEEGV